VIDHIAGPAMRIAGLVHNILLGWCIAQHMPMALTDTGRAIPARMMSKGCMAAQMTAAMSPPRAEDREATIRTAQALMAIPRVCRRDLLRRGTGGAVIRSIPS
jgi:hypothetical protein